MIFIKFDQAVFVKDNVEKVFDLEEIPRQVNFLEVIQNLYCPDSECEARLVFNRRGTGKIYLSKHKSDEHAEECSYFDDEIVPIKSITEYVEVNGDISNDGIKRRKLDAMKSFRKYINPPSKEKQKQKKQSNSRKKTSNETENSKKGVKVNYDPNGEVIKETTKDGSIKVKEPTFYERFPHQISEKDSGKNLRTTFKIEEIRIGSKKNEKYAEISGSLESVNITFVLPEEFFVGNERSLDSNQLLGYLEILKKYVETGSTDLYLTSLCQSRKIDMDDIVLYVLDPDFMCFQTLTGRDFPTLTTIIVAITTKVI